MELVAFLGKDKESWGQVIGLINNGDWEKIILLKSKDAISFPELQNTESIIIDTSQTLVSLKQELMQKLKGKFSGLDVHLSIASGDGKEHMAVIAALLSLPVGIRLAVFTKNGVEIVS